MTVPSPSSKSSHPGLLSGDLIAGKYRLEHEIGRGAMGTVWLATHLTLDQRVAIKIISREHADSAELRQRFNTEAKAAAKLRSRYVVGVHDHGETPDGLPFIVLEYLEGECLEDRIAREGTIPVNEAVRIARHVGRALSRAHARNIIHRDLKPANIFITKNEDDEERGWTAKVLDFGIAKMGVDYGEVSTTKTGAVLGTPLFMSPEQVRGASDVDHRADLYSLGMVVYNMLTGEYAFDGASFGDLLVSICTEPLPKLRDAAPWASDDLELWFERACARNPEDRFVDADEMVEALITAAGLGGHRASLVDVQTLVGAGLVSSAATTAPGAPLSRGDFTPVPRAGSYADLTSSSVSSAGAATVTVNLPPKRRSSWPWAAGAIALLTAVAGAALWRSQDPGGTSTGASLPVGAPPGEESPGVLPGHAAPAPSSPKPATPAPDRTSSTAATAASPSRATSQPSAPAAPQPPAEALAQHEPPAAAKPPVQPKPSPQPSRASKPAPASRPAPASKPASTSKPAPASRPTQSPSQPSVPDLGF